MGRGEFLAAAVERANHVQSAAAGGRLQASYERQDLFDTGQAVQQPIAQ